MKKSTLGQLAILGITSGLITVADGNIGLYADTTSFDAGHMIAKAKCKSGPGGSCAGLVAMRDNDIHIPVAPLDDELIEDEAEEKAQKEEKEKQERLDRARNRVQQRDYIEAAPEGYSVQEELPDATDDGSVKRDYQAPAFNKAGRTNVRMQNEKANGN